MAYGVKQVPFDNELAQRFMRLVERCEMAKMDPLSHVVCNDMGQGLRFEFQAVHTVEGVVMQPTKCELVHILQATKLPLSQAINLVPYAVAFFREESLTRPQTFMAESLARLLEEACMGFAAFNKMHEGLED